MKVRISAGHAKGKGANGFMEESKEARDVTKATKSMMVDMGHTCTNCTNDTDTDPTTNLKGIVKRHNMHTCDIHVSVHFNAFKKTKADGSSKGCEVLITGNNESAKRKATQICKNLESLGFKNRGVKERKDLYFLNNTHGGALLIEVCFVDDEDDYKLYKELGEKKIARAISYGLLEKNLPKAKYKVTATFTSKKKAREVKQELGVIASSVSISEFYE